MPTEMISPEDSLIELQCKPKALQHIRKKLEDQPASTGLRIRLKKSGCSGWTYKFDYAMQPQSDEITCTAPGGLRVFIQREYRSLFQEGSLEYVQSGLNGTVTFMSAHEGARCGCGESFTVAISPDDNRGY
jgi:iron-sulfur cluster assembly accessory protein